MRCHEVDRFRRDHLGRQHQVAFILAVLIVDHHDHASGLQLANGVRDALANFGELIS
jgi:hypothetical protein